MGSILTYGNKTAGLIKTDTEFYEFVFIDVIGASWLFLCIICNLHVQALKCLRRKKLLDARQAQHEQAIDKISAMMHMLQETESQKQVQAVVTLFDHSLKRVLNRAL